MSDVVLETFQRRHDMFMSGEDPDAHVLIFQGLGAEKLELISYDFDGFVEGLLSGPETAPYDQRRDFDSIIGRPDEHLSMTEYTALSSEQLLEYGRLYNPDQLRKKGVAYYIGAKLGHYLAAKNEIMLPAEIEEARNLREASLERARNEGII